MGMPGWAAWVNAAMVCIIAVFTTLGSGVEKVGAAQASVTNNKTELTNKIGIVLRIVPHFNQRLQ
jgi:hypothetical protein